MRSYNLTNQHNYIVVAIDRVGREVAFQANNGPYTSLGNCKKAAEFVAQTAAWGGPFTDVKIRTLGDLARVEFRPDDLIAARLAVAQLLQEFSKEDLAVALDAETSK